MSDDLELASASVRPEPTYDGGREIFVFGSNLAGRHGKGAALSAVKEHGAVYGVGEGLRGNSYAIPTKDWHIKTLPLNVIRLGVNRFLECAKARDDLTFRLTPIGCGLAGYKPEQIAPMFRDAPPNVILPDEFVGKLADATPKPPQETGL